MPSAQSVRESILSAKGLRVYKTGLTDKALLPEDKTGCKTSLMRHVEALHRMPIEELIWSDSIDNLVNRLEIPRRTLSYWRKKYPKKVEQEVA